MRRQTSGEEDERDDDESDERADEQTEREGQAVFAAAQVLDQLNDARVPRGGALNTISGDGGFGAGGAWTASPRTYGVYPILRVGGWACNS
jgi:hypothetical protein